ncbi:uncharacterized protein JCM6883_006389 [Sporobolomyces salmoneus]|uniref:uncharacterized protein n=1 Tax=Sporobolomyces salmoneus TaxID=183962 RepID=UPI003182523F
MELLVLEFPGGGKEWMGVFDRWVQWNIQEFVEVLEKESEVVEKEKVEKDETTTTGRQDDDSKFPSRPRAPKALILQTTSATTSKRTSPPTPTKSPVKKESVYIGAPLPSCSSSTIKATSALPSTTITSTLKPPRRSSPALPPPFALSNAKTVESEGRRRRSGQLSVATAPTTSTTQTVSSSARPPSAKTSIGLGFGSRVIESCQAPRRNRREISVFKTGSRGGRRVRGGNPA